MENFRKALLTLSSIFISRHPTNDLHNDYHKSTYVSTTCLMNREGWTFSKKALTSVFIFSTSIINLTKRKRVKRVLFSLFFLTFHVTWSEIWDRTFFFFLVLTQTESEIKHRVSPQYLNFIGWSIILKIIHSKEFTQNLKFFFYYSAWPNFVQWPIILGGIKEKINPIHDLHNTMTI